MLHFSVSLMNRLNKTESDIFTLCDFLASKGSPFSEYLHYVHKKKTSQDTHTFPFLISLSFLPLSSVGLSVVSLCL